MYYEPEREVLWIPKSVVENWDLAYRGPHDGITVMEYTFICKSRWAVQYYITVLLTEEILAALDCRAPAGYYRTIYSAPATECQEGAECWMVNIESRQPLVHFERVYPFPITEIKYFPKDVIEIKNKNAPKPITFS